MAATRRKVLLSLTVGYVLGNLLLYFVNPFASSWHYHTHDPKPITVSQSQDQNLSCKQLVNLLDDIDLAYQGREPTQKEKLKFTLVRCLGVVFMPATYALQMKEFIGYIGPANREQQAFTIAVKQRYNHLARVAVAKQCKHEAYLFQEEPSLSKKDGEHIGVGSPDAMKSPSSVTGVN
jgi:hypothetical protein